MAASHAGPRDLSPPSRCFLKPPEQQSPQRGIVSVCSSCGLGSGAPISRGSRAGLPPCGVLGTAIAPVRYAWRRAGRSVLAGSASPRPKSWPNSSRACSPGSRTVPAASTVPGRRQASQRTGTRLSQRSRSGGNRLAGVAEAITDSDEIGSAMVLETCKACGMEGAAPALRRSVSEPDG